MKYRIFELLKGHQKDTLKLCIAGEGRAIMKKFWYLSGQIRSYGKLRKSTRSQHLHQREI